MDDCPYAFWRGRITSSGLDGGGDHLDWIFTSYSLRPDNVRGLELGVSENSGPRHLEGSDKARLDFVKAFKTARDQLAHIVRVLQNECNSDSLPYQIVCGLKALFAIVVHVIGFQGVRS